ncbi:SpoVK/Ycf46/Vps4 family AAA+-type ATPase [Friedmanniella endophytica]|uniref:SpoVK/Ycf46/Vps4 family AAA+-type ATPase n=1 Tax=Microlunatus kandeliicorticis TaxID=1759536 RepID=A0A7W3P4F2_9ACTN|nr:ATP-binding protein [Microlunatus kandeliicorticis]MBA8792823.1 SpoVK/Ycf46/Vps4 family AAA+-type ATPase [Microlunatus kandeliicorticis]
MLADPRANAADLASSAPDASGLALLARPARTLAPETVPSVPAAPVAAAPVWDAPTAPDHVGGARSWKLLHSDLGLDDVHGLRPVVRRLRSAVRRAERLAAVGRSAGLLLYGPQGCGRTLLVRAVAGELGGSLVRLQVADLVTRASRTADPAETVELELAALFAAAVRTPSTVVLLDELDALTPGSEAGRTVWTAADAVVGRLAAELDGSSSTARRGRRVVLVGSTERPWLVPPALRGSDRLGPEVLVAEPDRHARRAILERRLAGPSVGLVNLRRLVRSTTGLSAADLVWVCTRARALASWDQLTGRGPGLVGMAELAAAVSEVRPTARLWRAERTRVEEHTDVPLSLLPARS